MCPHVLPGGGLHLFPERRDCYLIDGRDSGAAGRLDMCAWLEFFCFPHCFFSARKGISVVENVEMQEGTEKEGIRG